MVKTESLTAAELSTFMNVGWPGEDWYLEPDHESAWAKAFAHDQPGQLYAPKQPGDVLPFTEFDGAVRWQGNGPDPTGGEGRRLSQLVVDWRRKQDDHVLVAFVPKAKLQEVSIWLEQAGCLVAD